MNTFTFVDSIGQYDIEAVGIDPSYVDFDAFLGALVECAVACDWADEETARAAVEREEHALRRAWEGSHPELQTHYVGCSGVPARSGEHNDRAVFVGRDEATVRNEMESVWAADAWVTEWEWGGVWDFPTREEAEKFASMRAGGEYWEEVD